MKYVIGLCALAILAVIVLFAFDPSYQRQRENNAFYASQQQQLELERQQLRATADALAFERQQRADETTAPVSTGVQLLLLVLIPVGIIAAGYIVLDAYQQRRKPLVRADSAGMLPFDRAALQSGVYDQQITAALYGFHHAAIERAIHQPGQTPASVSYAPQYRNEQRNALETVAGNPLLPLEQVLGVPTFSQLLDQGRIGRGRSLLLGVDDTGQEVNGSWLDLYSTIVSGLPGSGKTTSQRFLACQTALQGARFVVVDPHAGASDDSLAATLAPLASAFLCEPASDDKAILSAVQLVADIGERRIKGKDTSTYPVILWLDETTALLNRSSVAEPLAELLEGIAQEYRKKAVFACASGQIWTASRSGGDSALRDSFASVICHRMKRSQARLLIPTDEAQTVERLSIGQAVLWRTSGETSVITIPDTTASDVVQVASLLTGQTTTPEHVNRNQATPETLLADLDAGWTRVGRGLDVTADAGNVPLESQSSAYASAPEEMRILSAFKAGSEVKDIIKTLYGNVNTGTREYRELRAKIEDTIRRAIG